MEDLGVDGRIVPLEGDYVEDLGVDGRIVPLEDFTPI